MHRMTEDECRAFVATGTRTAKLAIVRKDGRPHVTPVWFVLKDDGVVFMTHEDSLKGRILQRDPRVMLSVDDEEFPFAFVLAEGTATCERPAASELLPWSREIASRYVPSEMIESTAARNAVDGELLVHVEVTKWTGTSGVAE